MYPLLSYTMFYIIIIIIIIMIMIMIMILLPFRIQSLFRRGLAAVLYSPPQPLPQRWNTSNAFC